MLYARIRFGLIFLFLGLGILLHAKTGWVNAWYLYLASFFLLLTYFLFGNVWLAFNLLKKGKLAEAETVIRQIKHPRWLIKTNRAYYYFVKGMIHLQKKELKKGEKHLEKALELKLHRNNDRALASLNLAHINYLQKKFDASRRFLKSAKSISPDDLMIKQQIEKLEKALAALQ